MVACWTGLHEALEDGQARHIWRQAGNKGKKAVERQWKDAVTSQGMPGQLATQVLEGIWGQGHDPLEGRLALNHLHGPGMWKVTILQVVSIVLRPRMWTLPEHCLGLVILPLSSDVF